MKKQVKFGVFADLHVDIMHDAQERLEKFLEDCRKEDVDFIVQLGDFCYPDENRKCVCKPKNRPVNIDLALRTKTYADKDAIINMFNNFEKPSYHVLGNHECDMCSKEETLAYYNMTNGSYYSFDMGGFHFVVLDGSYYKIGDEYFAYSNGNYFDAADYDEQILPYVHPEELKWLEKDLANTQLPSILFSHQCMDEDNPWGVMNAAELKQILKNAPAGVVAALNGHEHQDYLVKQDGIWFVNINSISCCWIDAAFEYPGLYGAEIDEKYPNIKYTVPYKDPIYGIVTLDEDGMMIKGVQSDYVGPSPVERGVFRKDSWWHQVDNGTRTLDPNVTSRWLPFKK